jgi:hypothetical protein
MESNTTTPKREKMVLGGFETWVEYDQPRCCVTLFGFETAKHGLGFDVMGTDNNKHVNGFIYTGPFGGHASLTEQEKKELNNYLNNGK